MAKTHPHIDSPTTEQLVELAGDRPDNLVEVYLGLHELIVETLPDIRNSVDTVDSAIGYAARQYGYNGWGMAVVTPFSRWVSLTLLQGSKLSDPKGLLSGTSTMRHVKLSDPNELTKNREQIKALVLAASELNED